MSNKKAKGKRAKTRSKFKRKSSRLTVNKLLQEFKKGDYVQIVIDSSVHKGMPFRRFQGLSGKVSAIRGKSFEVELNDHGKYKTVIASSAHLKALGQKTEEKEAKEVKKAEEAEVVA